jgi:hypothetical protein
LRRCDEAAEVLTVSLASVAVASILGLLVVLTSMFVSSSLVRAEQMSIQMLQN